MTAATQSTADSSEQLALEAYTDKYSTTVSTPTIADLNAAYDDLTGIVRLLSHNVEDRRRTLKLQDLDDRTSQRARLESRQLLEELSTDRGLGWSEIAFLCGVSVSAVRKWRNGGSVTSENRRSLARLAAFLELVENLGPVEEPANWLSMRISDRHTVTAADLYVDDHIEDLLEYAQGHLETTELLGRWKADWESSARSEWVVATGPDGGRVLVPRED